MIFIDVLKLKFTTNDIDDTINYRKSKYLDINKMD